MRTALQYQSSNFKFEPHLDVSSMSIVYPYFTVCKSGLSSVAVVKLISDYNKQSNDMASLEDQHH